MRTLSCQMWQLDMSVVVESPLAGAHIHAMPDLFATASCTALKLPFSSPVMSLQQVPMAAV